MHPGLLWCCTKHAVEALLWLQCLDMLLFAGTKMACSLALLASILSELAEATLSSGKGKKRFLKTLHGWKYAVLHWYPKGTFYEWVFRAARWHLSLDLWYGMPQSIRCMLTASDWATSVSCSWREALMAWPGFCAGYWNKLAFQKFLCVEPCSLGGSSPTHSPRQCWLRCMKGSTFCYGVYSHNPGNFFIFFKYIPAVWCSFEHFVHDK